MSKPLHKITFNVKIGVYDSAYVARIYSDKITVVTPYIKWGGSPRDYAERRDVIRDSKIIAEVLQSVEGGGEDVAWRKIGHALRYGDGWLGYSGRVS